MGNRSKVPGRSQDTVRTILYPGYIVEATICVPQAHPRALWLLAWTESLLQGQTLESLLRNPPWPVPSDPVLNRQLLRELFDLRWATPDWENGGVIVDVQLRDLYTKSGQPGLASHLFDTKVVRGVWWMDALGGELLSTKTAEQFDWDFREGDGSRIRLEGKIAPESLLEQMEPDVDDLLRMLGNPELYSRGANRAYLASPLRLSSPKLLEFTLYGEESLLPSELGALILPLQENAPFLFRDRPSIASRTIRVDRGPAERLNAEVERVSQERSFLGPRQVLLSNLDYMVSLVQDTRASEWTRWYQEGHLVRSVAGPADRQFVALREMCQSLENQKNPVLLMTTAFLNPHNLENEQGLLDALAGCPAQTIILILYGHASEDPPEKQHRDIDTWLARARKLQLKHQVHVIPTMRRSHEKVVISSRGDWMLGSWNAGSSRPGSIVFECSLVGTSPSFAMGLLQKLADNVEGAETHKIMKALEAALLVQSQAVSPEPAEQAFQQLKTAISLLRQSIPPEGSMGDQAWQIALRVVRGALLPFLVRAQLQLVDEHQTRDIFAALIRGTRRDVLLASDRLADSALDGATLQDLRGDHKKRPIVRVVWGREWARKISHESDVQEQLCRARNVVNEAREFLGDQLCTSNEPMENHAKLVLVDGMRGIVTSENLLSYGGEKGRYETRELGIVFSCPPLARHILGRFLAQWPSHLQASKCASLPLELITMGNEAWYAFDSIRDQLDFNFENPRYIAAAIHDDLERNGSESSRAHTLALRALMTKLGDTTYQWLRNEGERAGLLLPSDTEHWIPYDQPLPVQTLVQWMQEAEEAIHAQVSASTIWATSVIPSQEPSVETDPRVASILRELVLIPAGMFWMGDNLVANERPRHQVVISQPFLMARTVVTQSLWEDIMGSLPHLDWKNRHPTYPIVHVSYHDIQEFLARLNSLAGSGGFDLPTEAQWEYACRAGSVDDYCFGSDPGWTQSPGKLEEYAWTKRNSDAHLHAVAQLNPNAWGLFDMHGLVYESVKDALRVFQTGPVTDPMGPLDEATIGARGGAWGRFPTRRNDRASEHFRCSCRQFHPKTEQSERASFRIIRILEKGGTR